jgi:hypothetical protein
MASTYSTDLSLELITTGEKAGLWGTIQNTNLKLLQTAASGYTTVTLSSGTTTLSLADGSDSANGKHLYLRLTGTLSGNAALEMPATTTGGNANRVFFVEDATDRTTSQYTIQIFTTGQSGSTYVNLPTGAKALIYSVGATPASYLSLLQPGVKEIDSAVNTTYTAVSGDVLLIRAATASVTVTLPAAPAMGDEVTIMDSSVTGVGFGTNNCIVNPNSLNIQQGSGNYTMATNNQCVVFYYTNATMGWQVKSNSTS